MSRIIIVIVLLLSASTAHANRDDGWVVGVQAGLGTPLGSLGVEGGWVISPNLTWTGGLGLGIDNTPQAGTMLRLATGGPGIGAAVGAGVSVGGWTGMSSWLPNDYRLDADWLGFANLEASIHYQFEPGGRVRVLGGLQEVVAGDITCSLTSESPESPTICATNKTANNDSMRWPYLAVAFEY